MCTKLKRIFDTRRNARVGCFFRRESTIQPVVEIAADTGIVSSVSIMDEVMDKD